MPSSLESLRDIKLKALQIQPYLEGDNKQWIEKIKESYKDLVDRFYHKNEEMIASQQTLATNVVTAVGSCDLYTGSWGARVEDTVVVNRMDRRS